MNIRNPEEVVIVGGGIAGSMTAAYLKAAFRDRISVTLVDDESGRSATGHDETTLSDIPRFFGFLGLAEEDWM